MVYVGTRERRAPYRHYRTSVADRSVRFFMSPDEAEDYLRLVAADGVQMVVAGRRGDAPHRHDPEIQIAPSSGFAYLGFAGLSTGDPGEVVKNPGAGAWVRFALPRLKDRVLLMSYLDIRTKWLDHDNPAGLDVFKGVAKRLRPMLSRPTLIWHVSNGEPEPIRGVGFTTGAARLHDDGVEWMQEGVLNSRFGPPRSSA
jgi:hypothetical protein